MRYERNPQNGRLAIPCERCGEQFLVWPSRSTRRFCSWGCAHPYATGADRFWSKVAVAGPTACWMWTAFRNADGYGVFGDRSYHTVHAHRYAFFLTHGRWPAVCRHTCDTPACCNPAHLLDGDQAENIRDRVVRGRSRGGTLAGAQHPRAKLSEAQARAVVKRRESDAALARHYSVSVGAIAALRRGRTWVHLERPDGPRRPREPQLACVVCGKVEPPLRRGRCNACRLYFARCGSERPTRLH